MRATSTLVLLAAVALPAAAADITATKSKDAIDFKDGAATVATYHVGEGVAKPYLWPLNAPGGVAVTRAWPMVKGEKGETTDHVHQKSAWFCHGDVIPQGVELKTKSADKHVQGVDFWSETAGHGVIACVEVGEVETVSKVAVRVPTKNEWRTADGVKILDESRTVGVWRLPHGYLVTFDIDLHASVCGITFGDTKEGSFGVRVPDAFAVQAKTGGTVTASDGKTAAAGTKDNLTVWGQPADWHDYSGKVGDADAGIAVFDHPDDAPRAAWHTRAYGLMAANPFARAASGFPSQKGKTELTTLKKGDRLKLRYAIYAHTGDATAGDVAAAFKTYTAK